ncbi:carbonic anhydrase [Herbihabitans rhizosphaerae]|uniref:carbonic anhydrase n=1 Tax=Herbihabitans rhizosphaerae TaxID=1872711 RepID=A0A4Q7KCU3_9PSEU|nr:carbonic anhydrase family protein [Herbihabitans rhizosphaerae]RZS31348.1 carbonic anhydrase [Herbihabitans rhizosphaerae]
MGRKSYLLGVVAAVALAWAGSTAVGEAVGAQGDRASGRQSPVDVRVADVVPADLPRLRFEYPASVNVQMHYVRDDDGEPDGCLVRGEEETVRAIVPAGAARLVVGDETYELQQVHWHTPAEHRVNGHRYPLEEHFVHKSASGKQLVVGVLVANEHAHNDQVGRLFAAMPHECRPDRGVGNVHLRQLLPRDLAVSYRYDGSLTTYPYTEGVSWIMLRQPLAVGHQQIDQFARTFPRGNAREVRPLGDRTVLTERPPR